MNFSTSLELTQSQKLILTTQLKQSLKILHMSSLELEEEINRLVEENPLLDIDKKSETNWELYIKNVEKSYQFDKNELYYNSDNDINLENIIRSTCSLYESLHFQVSLYKLNKIEKETCTYIIDSLDDDGYLRINEYEIKKELNINDDTFKKCLEIVQQLEPIGIGARSLSESLIIQLRNLGIQNKLLENIISKDLELIGNKKYKDIVKKYNISMKKCLNFINIIKALNPKPGRIYCDEKSVYVKPDVIVEKIDNEFLVYSNERDSLKVSINKFYKEILKNSKYDKDTKNFIKDKLNSANVLIKSIEERKATVLNIAKEIIKHQELFFEYGDKYIKPMKMKEIAKVLQLHESTISRGVNGKYMLTPFGIYEFKYFFSNSLDTNNEGLVSSISIKNMIQDTIKSEDKTNPLSDNQISKILNNRGINIARRTISKYREELGILSSSKRKEY